MRFAFGTLLLLLAIGGALLDTARMLHDDPLLHWLGWFVICFGVLLFARMTYWWLIARVVGAGLRRTHRRGRW